MEKEWIIQLEKAHKAANTLIWELLNVRDHRESTSDEKGRAAGLVEDAGKIRDAIESIARERAGK